MPLQPFAGADPFLGRLPARTAVLSYLDHRLGPDGPGRLPAFHEWPERLRLIPSTIAEGPEVLAAAIRSMALMAQGRDLPHTVAKVMPSTSGPVAWCEGPTWAVIGLGSSDDQRECAILGLVENRPGVCFDLTGDRDASAAIDLLVATLVYERERARELEPLTRPLLRGLPPLTA